MKINSQARESMESLVDQLFNSSERRLTRTLLLMAEFGKRSEPESMIPKITQETLAEMIGTTRSAPCMAVVVVRCLQWPLRD